jgi:NAD(P)-dependent dehydrogenase (short-subunit alcohol dehydrogenase family)
MPGDLSGRAFLVTGGNTGIGLATATGLAARGGRVCITSRSAAKAVAAVAAITAATGNAGISWLQLNLADLAAVRASAQEFLDRGEPLHVLINNAGLAGQRGRTADGFELAFGVNHLGTFAFTTALLDHLAASGPARVVTVSSDAHYAAKGIDFTTVRRRTRSVTGLPEYQVSKLGNVLLSQELARRLAGAGVTSYALHPGLVASDIWRRVPWPARSLLTRRMLSTQDGALTSLYCATSPDVAGDSGLFYNNCQARPASPRATPELGQALWEQSEAWIGA